MTQQEVLDLINQFIVTNGNNEITANVLNPILEEIVNQPNLLIGVLSQLNTSDQTNLVNAINEVYNMFGSVSDAGIRIYEGIEDPNITPPVEFKIGDFYIQKDLLNNPVKLFQYNGFGWFPPLGIFDIIDDSIIANDSTWSSEKIVDEIETAISGAGTVTEVTGVPGEITVANGTTTPVIGIDSAYTANIETFAENLVNGLTNVTDVSIQNKTGFEQFRMTDLLRFEGTSFDVANKTVRVDPLLSLSAYIDVVNGSDVNGVIENANRPFKTIEALFSALPAGTETYTIYIKNSSVVPFVRRVVPRNIRWVSYSDVSLDFTNVKENDGVTDAVDILTDGTLATWTFDNENIAIRCLSGNKRFGYSASGSNITFKGVISNHNWFSTNFFGLGNNTDLRILNVNDVAGASTGIFKTQVSNLTINTLRVTAGRQLYVEAIIGSTLVINRLLQIGGSALNYTFGHANLDFINIGNSTLNGAITPICKRINLTNATLSATCRFNFGQIDEVSGNLTSTLYNTTGFFTKPIRFVDFIGKLSLCRAATNAKLIFDNCSVEVDTYLVQRDAVNANTNLVEFYRYNKLTQINTAVDLFRAYDTTTLAITPFNIVIQGAVTTNVTRFGLNVSSIYSTNTFKEKAKEIVIRSKEDIANKVLSSEMNYIIDGTITLLPTESIIVPVGGLSLSGYGFDVSSIKATGNSSTIFTSPVGGCGNLFIQNLSFESSGTGSKVFNLTNAGAPTGGADAIELNVVNFDNCTSLGELTNFRQGLWNNVGIFGVKDGLTFSGVWSGGFRADLTIVRNFGTASVTSTLFKAGTGLLFKSRLYTDLNADFKVGGSISDFTTSNFDASKLYQIKGALITRNGVLDPTQNYTGILTQLSSVSDWQGNNGIYNSTSQVADAVNNNEAMTLGQLGTGFESAFQSSTQAISANTDTVLSLTGSTMTSNGGLDLVNENTNTITPLTSGDVISIDVAIPFTTPSGTDHYGTILLRVKTTGTVYRAKTQPYLKGAGNQDYLTAGWVVPINSDAVTNGLELVVNSDTPITLDSKFISVTRVHKAK